MTALEKSRETRSGSFAIQYLYAVGSPSPASMAMTGGHRTTTRRSPRPAGPSARAPTRLEIIVDSSIVESVMKMSFALRAITVSLTQVEKLAREVSSRHEPEQLRGWYEAGSMRPVSTTSDRCSPGRVASTARMTGYSGQRPATDK